MSPRVLLFGLMLTIFGLGGFLASVELRLAGIENRMAQHSLALALLLPLR